jgi:putative Holliday junction resolvase
MRYFGSDKAPPAAFAEDPVWPDECQGKQAGARAGPDARLYWRKVRIMALDVGEVRIGVALSDERETLASALTTLKAVGARRDAHSVAALARQHAAGSIVVGVPYRLDGSVGPQAEKVLAFAERLRRSLRLPVATWDERLTSVEAGQRLAAAGVKRRERKARLDSAAAALILQEYLDSRRAAAATLVPGSGA